MSRLAMYSEEIKPKVYEYALLHFTGYVNTSQIQEIVTEVNEKINYDIKHFIYTKISFNQVFFYGVDVRQHTIKAILYPRKFVRRVVTFHTNEDKLKEDKNITLLKELMKAYVQSRKNILAN